MILQASRSSGQKWEKGSLHAIVNLSPDWRSVDPGLICII